LLINPGLPLLTVDVFKAFAAAEPIYSPAAPLAATPASIEALVEMLELRHNDLQPTAEHLIPAISGILDRLGQTQGCLLARLSGSGPTCFGLFADPDAAGAAGRAIAAEYPDWWVRSGVLLSGAAGGQAAGAATAAC